MTSETYSNRKGLLLTQGAFQTANALLIPQEAALKAVFFLQLNQTNSHFSSYYLLLFIFNFQLDTRKIEHFHTKLQKKPKMQYVLEEYNKKIHTYTHKKYKDSKQLQQ